MPSSRPPRFKPQTAPLAIAAQKATETGRFRGSPRDRGYDARWDRLSIEFRRRHPFCIFCEQAGRDTLTDLVDHIVPVVDRPDLRYDWENLCSLCKRCHGKKFQMEAFARAHDLLDVLPIWVRAPDRRPQQFRSL
jgi:5-methylcytosine-specific restriction endonuclease McrA